MLVCVFHPQVAVQTGTGTVTTVWSSSATSSNDRWVQAQVNIGNFDSTFQVIN
jgi:hypothetical protein